jgi:predicted transcriptional regulator
MCKNLFGNAFSSDYYYCMKNRSKIDIIGPILESVDSATAIGIGDDHDNYNGITKSKIMYNVFLSYAQLQEYLSVLLETGLIEKYQKELEEKEKKKQRSSYYYRITDKGRCFLQIYRDLSEMIMIAYR